MRGERQGEHGGPAGASPPHEAHVGVVVVDENLQVGVREVVQFQQPVAHRGEFFVGVVDRVPEQICGAAQPPQVLRELEHGSAVAADAFVDRRGVRQRVGLRGHGDLVGPREQAVLPRNQFAHAGTTVRAVSAQ